MLTELMYLSTLSILLPIALGAIFFRGLKPPIKILYVFIVSCGIMELWTAILFFQNANNLFLFHAHTFIEFSLLSVIYFKIIPSRICKIGILAISSSFLVYLTYSISVNDLHEFDSNNRVIESGILISYFIAFMVIYLYKFKAPYLDMNPYFILTAGLFIYFIGVILVFLYYSELADNQFMSAWTIHSLLNIFLNLIYSSVIWRSNKV